MSTNCIHCVKNKRTGGDLLCDVCRILKKFPTFQPMDSAPRDSTEIIGILRCGDAVIMHYAEDLSGSDQPPFKGWFISLGNGTCYPVSPVGWREIDNEAKVDLSNAKGGQS